MKKTKALQKAVICAILCASLLSLYSCAEDAGEAPTDEITSNITEDAYNEKIAYCMSQINDLNEQLKAEKEQNYVNESKYQTEISALEQTIEILKSQLNGDTSVQKPQTPSKDLPYTYTKENNCITITKYTGYDEIVIIPEKIEDCTVVCIGESAFDGTAVKSVIIPEGVVRIDWFAFRACTRLTEISIPSTVTSIEYGAFDSAKQNFVIKCKNNSFAQKYADSWGYICVAE